MRAFYSILTILVITFLIFSSIFVPGVIANLENDLDNENSTSYDVNYYPMNSGTFETPPVHTQNAIKSIVDDVSVVNLKSYVTRLQNFGSRLYRAPGMFNASIWLHDALKGNGRLEPSYDNFTVVRPTWGTFTLSNVILTLPGLNESSDRIYYMFAHSDAVQFTDSNQWLTNTPGADDDGSGCSSVLEAARVLSNYKFQDTIKFAFFNAEEIGLIGSSRYAANMSTRGENVLGSIDYDMIGYSVGAYEHDLTLTYNSASSAQGLYEVDVNDRYKIGLSIDAVQTASSIPSDIQSFYSRGFPGVFGIEYDFSPYYHSTSDLVKYLNMTLMEKCTELAVASLAEMARLMYTDLAIYPDQVVVSDAYPIAGEKINISVNVTNTGNLNASNTELVFYADGEPISSSRFDVPAYGFNTTNTTWNATLGKHNITVAIDPKNEIIEANETNNFGWAHVLANDRPNVIFTVVPLKVLTFESILFNGSNSYDIYGGVEQYNISFGDGNYTGWSNNSTTEHSYSDDGIYEASLTVKDIFGEISKSVSLNVQVLNRPPFADPGSNISRTTTFSNIQFYSNATDLDGMVTVLWEFGDGERSTEFDPIHSYNYSGKYSVKLQVEDDDGAQVNYELPITIRNRPHNCKLYVSPSIGNITTEFIFTYEIFDIDTTSFWQSWDFGDGGNKHKPWVYTDEKINIIDIYHQYKAPGTYNVILTVKDIEGIEAFTNLTVTVLDLPPVALVKTVSTEVDTFETIYFDGRDSHDLEGPISYHWSFGDGNTSSEALKMHSYSIPGTYNVTLKVTDYNGQSDTFYLPNIIVNNQLPKAVFSVFGTFIEKESLVFDASKSFDIEGNVLYSWEFGDGGTSTSGPVVEHIFSDVDNYSVKLTVTDLYGASDWVVQVIKVKTKSVYIPDNGDDPEIPDNNKSDNQDKVDGDKNISTGDNNDESNDRLMSLLIISNIIFIILFLLVFLFLILAKRKNNSDPQNQEKVIDQELEPMQRTEQPVYTQNQNDTDQNLNQPVLPQTDQPQVPEFIEPNQYQNDITQTEQGQADITTGEQQG